MEDRSAWLRTARMKQGMTQEKLAAMASVSVRTVQRAEEGRKMSAEVWKDFEAALGSTPTLARRSETKVDRYRQFRTLRKARTAKDLLDAIRTVSVAKLDYDVEPNSSILPVLTRSLGFLEARLPQPWDSNRRSYCPATLVQRVEDEAKLNELIEELHGIGASIFFEVQWADVVYPREGFDGDLYVDNEQEPEGRFLLHVMISASEKDRELFPEVYDWGVTVAVDADDEVPF